MYDDRNDAHCNSCCIKNWRLILQIKQRIRVAQEYVWLLQKPVSWTGRSSECSEGCHTGANVKARVVWDESSVCKYLFESSCMIYLIQSNNDDEWGVIHPCLRQRVWFHIVPQGEGFEEKYVCVDFVEGQNSSGKRCKMCCAWRYIQCSANHQTLLDDG